MAKRNQDPRRSKEEADWAKEIKRAVARTSRQIETQVFIREAQQSRAYRLPAQFAPEGRLRESERQAYQTLVKQYYQYGLEDDEVTLELWELQKNDVPQRVATVGEVFSLDLEWAARDCLRIHLIATRPSPNAYVLHYEVFDLGFCGLAYTVPMRALDNWRTWSMGDRVAGVPLDKRLLFIAIGDRAKIGNMELEEFARLDKEQVMAIMDTHRYGDNLVRPSIEDAALDERTASPSPPVYTIATSSSSPSPPSPPRGKGRGEVRSPREVVSQCGRMPREG